MPDLTPYQSSSGQFSFSKGPKSIYHGLGDENLLSVVLNVPQTDDDDEWGGTQRIADEVIVDEISSLIQDVRGDDGTSTADGLNYDVAQIKTIVDTATPSITVGNVVVDGDLDTIQIGSVTSLTSTVLTLNTNLVIDSGTNRALFTFKRSRIRLRDNDASNYDIEIKVDATSYVFGASNFTVPSGANLIATTATFSGAVSIGSLSSSGDISVGDITCTKVTATGGNVSAAWINASVDVQALGNITAGTNLQANANLVVVGTGSIGTTLTVGTNLTVGANLTVGTKIVVGTSAAEIEITPTQVIAEQTPGLKSTLSDSVLNFYAPDKSTINAAYAQTVMTIYNSTDTSQYARIEYGSAKVRTSAAEIEVTPTQVIAEQTSSKSILSSSQLRFYATDKTTVLSTMSGTIISVKNSVDQNRKVDINSVFDPVLRVQETTDQRAELYKGVLRIQGPTSQAEYSDLGIRVYHTDKSTVLTVLGTTGLSMRSSSTSDDNVSIDYQSFTLRKSAIARVTINENITLSPSSGAIITTIKNSGIKVEDGATGGFGDMTYDALDYRAPNLRASLTATGFRVYDEDQSTLVVQILQSYINFKNLPTNDPGGNGFLWNHNGTVKIT